MLVLIFGIWILFFSINVKASGYSDIDNATSVHIYTGTYEVSRDSNGEYKTVVYADTGMGKVIKSSREGISNWDKEYVYTDQVGSTAFNLDTNGNVTPEFKDNNNNLNKLRYFAYGSTIEGPEANMLPTADTYTGQKKDTKLDLMYYNARYYDPTRGRFIQADSVNDGLNRYMYVAGNPVNANDPSGKQLCVSISCVLPDIQETQVYDDTVNIILSLPSSPLFIAPEIIESFHNLGVNVALDFRSTSFVFRNLKISNNWDKDYEIVEKAFSIINPEVYQGTTIEFNPLFNTGGNGQVSLMPNATYQQIKDGVLGEAITKGLIGEFPDIQGVSNDYAQEIVVMHEYFHVYQDQHPEVVDRMQSLYDKYSDDLKQNKIRSHIDDPKQTQKKEIGPILSVEEVYRHQSYYRKNFEEIYNYVYDLGFFRPGVLMEPNR